MKLKGSPAKQQSSAFLVGDWLSVIPLLHWQSHCQSHLPESGVNSPLSRQSFMLAHKDQEELCQYWE
jgi:hypothetical protein